MKDGYSHQCRKCEMARQAKYANQPHIREQRQAAARARRTKVGPPSPEHIRRQRLWTWYRMTLEDYAHLFEQQGGVCAICLNPETALSRNGGVKALAVDHDHACCPGSRACGQCIRGLLCSRCNPMLGYAHDNPEVLRAGLDYLLRSADRS